MEVHTSAIDEHTYKLERQEKIIQQLLEQMHEVQYVCFQREEPTNRFVQIESLIY